MGLQLALAASARDWPDRLHRFLVDHGGGRVRSRVMGPEQALADDFDVLLIDDICSFLTPRLVSRLRDLGKESIGVYDPSDGPDAKRRLLECGISDVIESEAPPEELLRLVSATLAHRPTSQPSRRRVPHACVIGVMGIAGSGVTEISIALAHDLAARTAAVLVDLDLEQPSVAQRLDLPVYPNLLTAVDLVHHEGHRLGETLLEKDGVDILVGPPATAGAEKLPEDEVYALVTDLAADRFSFVVADLGSGVPSLRLSALDVAIVVGSASPVGLTRLLQLIAPLAGAAADLDILPVVNRAPRGSRRADDIRLELSAALDGRHVLLIGEDRRLDRAAWDGRFFAGGGFGRSIKRLGRLIHESAMR